MAKPSSVAREPTPIKPLVARFEFASVQHHAQNRREEAIFIEFAAAGWELVSVTESANFDRRYYFKRPV